VTTPLEMRFEIALERLEVLLGIRGDGTGKALTVGDEKTLAVTFAEQLGSSTSFIETFIEVASTPGQVTQPIATVSRLEALSNSLAVDYEITLVAAEAAETARDAAAQSAQTAATEAGNASTSAGAAAQSQTDAGLANSQAATFAQAAADSESAAAGAASAAATAQTAAETSATGSATSATAAQSDKVAAETAAGEASVSQQAAATSESGASNAFNAAVAVTDVAAKLLTSGANVLESPFFEAGTFNTWGVATGRTVRVNDVYSYGQSVDFDLTSTVAAEVGIQWASDIPATWIGSDHHAGYSVTVEFDWVSGASLDGAGIFATWLKLSDGLGVQINVPLKDILPDPAADIVSGRRYTANVIIERPSDLAYNAVQEFNLTLVADSTSLFAGPVSKQIVFHKITVVPITVLEARVRETTTAVAAIDAGLGATLQWQVVAGGASSYLEVYAWDDLNGTAVSGLTFSANQYTFEGGMLLFKDAVLQSDDYAVDTAGWRIDNTGYAQFNELLITGNMVADGFITARMFEAGSVKAPLGAIDAEGITANTTTFQFKHAGFAIIYAIGAGGGGACAKSWDQRPTATGGGGGGFASLLLKDPDMAELYTITIGAGGPQVLENNNRFLKSGNDGGNTSMVGAGINIQCSGGSGGNADLSSGTPSALGGLGGAATGGNFNYTGGRGGNTDARDEISVGGCMDFGAASADIDGPNGMIIPNAVTRPMDAGLLTMQGAVPAFIGFNGSNFAGDGDYAVGGRGGINNDDNASYATGNAGGPGLIVVVYYGERGIV
jgi:hypothetical protein